MMTLLDKAWTRVLLALVLFGFQACSPQSPQTRSPKSSQPLSEMSLKLMDPVDASDPALDLIAVSVDEDAGGRKMKLTFLDGPSAAGLTIYILLSAGVEMQSEPLPFQATNAIPWDGLMVLNLQGRSGWSLPGEESVYPIASAGLHEDREMGSLSVEIPAALQNRLTPTEAQIFITQSTKVIDATDGFSIEKDASSDARSRVLLAFWDTLPASTPAQALRRWNGAHTGPFGQRHGLYHLLAAAEQYQVPIALLDLIHPRSLFALESMDQLSWIQKLRSEGLILLPDLAYGDPAEDDVSTSISHTAAESMGLKPDPFLYGTAGYPFPGRYPSVFARIGDPTHVIEYRGTRFISLPETDESLPTALDRDGLTVELKQALVQAALSGDPAQITVIGGSLPNSPWADSSIAPAAFRYLSQQDWIQVLDSQSLQQLPPHESPTLPLGACQTLICTQNPTSLTLHNADGSTFQQDVSGLMQDIRYQLHTLQPGLLTDAAWDNYLQLTQPVQDPDRQKLQAQYLPSVYRLIDAARWLRSPAPASGCFDAGCVLASQTGYYWIDPLGGRLLVAVSKTSTGVVQWIAPAAQYGVGSGDWDLSRGPLADQSDIPGAFSLSGVQQQFSARTAENLLILTSVNPAMTKAFRLLPDGLEVTVDTDLPGAYNFPIPLVSGRLTAQSPANRIASIDKMSANAFKVTYPSGPQISATLKGAEWALSTFQDSAALMRKPEDPDLSYPPGHFLPYPIARIVIQSNGAFQAEFHFQ